MRVCVKLLHFTHTPSSIPLSSSCRLVPLCVCLVCDSIRIGGCFVVVTSLSTHTHRDKYKPPSPRISQPTKRPLVHRQIYVQAHTKHITHQSLEAREIVAVMVVESYFFFAGGAARSSHLPPPPNVVALRARTSTGCATTAAAAAAAHNLRNYCVHTRTRDFCTRMRYGFMRINCLLFAHNCFASVHHPRPHACPTHARTHEHLNRHTQTHDNDMQRCEIVFRNCLICE